MKDFDLAIREKVEQIFKQKAEVLDLFVKTFVLTDVGTIERFGIGSLELVQQQVSDSNNITYTYRCQFIPFDELEKKKRKLVKQKAIEKLLQEARYSARKEVIEEIEDRYEESLGVSKNPLINHLRAKFLPKEL